MTAAGQYAGVLAELLGGRWADPATNQPVSVPLGEVAIADSLAGAEAQLVAAQHPGARISVVADEVTWEIMGRRIDAALADACAPLILPSPKADLATVEQVQQATAAAGALVAVGSGTVTDLVKHATFLSGRTFSVFATSPMNAYTTASASLLVDGAKRSLGSHCARGVFFELDTLAQCPPRLLANALADVVCRSSAQIDWLLSRDFMATAYSELPYLLLAADERELYASADRLLAGDRGALAALVRTCVLNGVGALITGTTHSGSMAEHAISHYLDMFAAAAHPGSLHGEQVGVATLTVMDLQQQILGAAEPPPLASSAVAPQELVARYGAERGAQFARANSAKELDAAAAAGWNRRWAGGGWARYVAGLRGALLPGPPARRALRAAGAAVTATELGFAADLYRAAVRDARHLRDRFSILDVAAAAGRLDDFVDAMPV